MGIGDCICFFIYIFIFSMKSGYVSIPKGKEEGYRYIRPLLEISVFGKEGNQIHGIRVGYSD